MGCAKGIKAYLTEIESSSPRKSMFPLDASLPFLSFIFLQKCLELKNSLLAQQKGVQLSLERLKTLVRLIQNESMIQVTMTTTTTSSLLSVPWIKPSASAVAHKALQPTQGNNWWRGPENLFSSTRRGTASPAGNTLSTRKTKGYRQLPQGGHWREKAMWVGLLVNLS